MGASTNSHPGRPSIRHSFVVALRNIDMASSSSTSAGGDADAPPPPSILDESARLDVIRTQIDALWRTEVSAYEDLSSRNGGAGAEATGNRPNAFGIVGHDLLFPYHTALYPLLDCYDSIRDEFGEEAIVDEAAVRPSPAPPPFEPNCHRRSRYGPRLDRHGVHIEELATLRNHLPNSAWAIKTALMPRARRDELDELLRSAAEERNEGEGSGGDGGGGGEGEPNAEAVDNDNDDDEGGNGDDEDGDGNVRDVMCRFWNVLMDPSPTEGPGGGELPAFAPSDVSVPPAPEEEGEGEPTTFWGEGGDDDGGGEEQNEEEVGGGDDDDNWEDVDDDEEEGTEGAEAPVDAAASQSARDAQIGRAHV